jgi:predicted metal-dependent HD superfamily phosphohydrolase
MRIERVVLEHHGNVAVAGRQVADLAGADADLAAADLFEAGDHAQQRGLAAARWADENHELPVGDIDAEVLDDVDRAEALLDVVKGDGCHEIRSCL